MPCFEMNSAASTRRAHPGGQLPPRAPRNRLALIQRTPTLNHQLLNCPSVQTRRPPPEVGDAGGSSGGMGHFAPGRVIVRHGVQNPVGFTPRLECPTGGSVLSGRPPPTRERPHRADRVSRLAKLARSSGPRPHLADQRKGLSNAARAGRRPAHPRFRHLLPFRSNTWPPPASRCPAIATIATGSAA